MKKIIACSLLFLSCTAFVTQALAESNNIGEGPWFINRFVMNDTYIRGATPEEACRYAFDYANWRNSKAGPAYQLFEEYKVETDKWNIKSCFIYRVNPITGGDRFTIYFEPK